MVCSELILPSYRHIGSIGAATGLVQLQEVITEFTTKVYQPAYKNFKTLVHTGNTDGWSKAVQTLCNPGEGILVSEWTYPSALSVSLVVQQ
jgi:aromatic amino acid aminotransferase I